MWSISCFLPFVWARQRWWYNEDRLKWENNKYKQWETEKRSALTGALGQPSRSLPTLSVHGQAIPNTTRWKSSTGMPSIIFIKTNMYWRTNLLYMYHLFFLFFIIILRSEGSTSLNPLTCLERSKLSIINENVRTLFTASMGMLIL